MQTTLMRHGKPILTKTLWLAPFQMEQWIAHYNRSVVESHDIPAESRMAALSASTIAVSTASRALSSVQVLGHSAAVKDPVFLEAELPFSTWRWPRLPGKVWAAVFRLLWLCGYSRRAESLRNAKVRAGAAARQLVNLAEHGPVLLLGHGIMNRLISRELETLGWAARSKPSNGYWQMGMYELPGRG